MPLVKTHVRFEALKKTIHMYLGPTDKLAELERQLNNSYVSYHVLYCSSRATSRYE